MAAITTRQTAGGTGVTNNNAPLSNTQIDQNFINLNAELITKLPLAGGTLTGNLTGTTFTGVLRGGVTGATDTTIWCVSGDNPTWGIFYNEGTPDLIEFKAAGVVKATIALDDGAASFGGVTCNNFVSTLSTTAGFSAIRGAASGSANFVLQSNGSSGSAFWISAKTDSTLHIGANGGTEPATGAIVVGATGNVGVGVAPSTYKLQVNGSFAATTKSFVIDHPTKPNMQLRYGSLEGPENGVYIRGRTKNNTIELPDYWTKLVDPDSITVNLTPIGSHQKLYIDRIQDNCVYIGTDNLFGKAIDCFYTVFAERCDVEKLKVEI